MHMKADGAATAIDVVTWYMYSGAIASVSEDGRVVILESAQGRMVPARVPEDSEDDFKALVGRTIFVKGHGYKVGPEPVWIDASYVRVFPPSPTPRQKELAFQEKNKGKGEAMAEALAQIRAEPDPWTDEEFAADLKALREMG